MPFALVYLYALQCWGSTVQNWVRMELNGLLMGWCREKRKRQGKKKGGREKTDCVSKEKGKGLMQEAALPCPVSRF